jgi:hypothetical protein
MKNILEKVLPEAKKKEMIDMLLDQKKNLEVADGTKKNYSTLSFTMVSQQKELSSP